MLKLMGVIVLKRLKLMGVIELRRLKLMGVRDNVEKVEDRGVIVLRLKSYLFYLPNIFI